MSTPRPTRPWCGAIMRRGSASPRRCAREPSVGVASPKGPTCWFAQFSATPCEGQLRRCHLLSQQRLRQEYPSGALWLSDREKALSRRSYARDGLAVIHEAQEDGPTIVRRMSLRELQEDSRLWRPGCGGIAGVSAHHG